jgi:hypothetical protein
VHAPTVTRKLSVSLCVFRRRFIYCGTHHKMEPHGCAWHLMPGYVHLISSRQTRRRQWWRIILCYHDDICFALALHYKWITKVLVLLPVVNFEQKTNPERRRHGCTTSNSSTCTNMGRAAFGCQCCAVAITGSVYLRRRSPVTRQYKIDIPFHFMILDLAK